LQVEDYLESVSIPVIPEARPKVLDGVPVLLEVKDLKKTFEVGGGFWLRKRFTAVESVSLQLKRGETLGIVGESGSGKTTLGLSIMRLYEPDAGSIWFAGEDVLAADGGARQSLKRRMQIVFQNPYASLNPRFTVLDILTEPMRIHGVGEDDRDRLQRARDLMAKVGLPSDALARYPHEFSGGQRQRIAIARCLTLSPELLVLDESVSALDVSVQAQVLNLLKSLQADLGLSYLFISHDLNVVRYMSDRIMVMRSGQVVEEGQAEDLFAGQAHHPYTRELLRSIPGAKFSA
jgi:peptide/nickel transport system ATP-binding protein